MGLLQSEIRRIRDELGYNVLNAGAEPYISTSAIFDQVIAQYMQAGAATTSTTLVAAQRSPTLVQLTLASPTGFVAGTNVAVDVDFRYEQARIEQVAGSVITVQLTLAHGDSGGSSYSVTEEGGEMIVREKLREIANIKKRLSKASTQAGLKEADEVQWYEGKQGLGGPLAGLFALLSFWRDELAHTLGVVNLRSVDGSGTGGTASVPVLY